VIANQDDGGLTLGLIISAVLALWGASGAVSALMQAMNMAYHETEKRTFVHLTGLTLGFTFGGRYSRRYSWQPSRPFHRSSMPSISARFSTR
jgi:hypothetical protein